MPEMITGYNTDVKHNERVFHVQTEDKGMNNPYIETLIYVGGQVLAAKRTNYAELLESGGERSEVGRMMDEQHRGMITSIKNGDYEQKLQELFGTQALESTAAMAAQATSNERTLDEVILEYLTSEAQQDHLVLFLEEDVELALGQSTQVTLRASSSKSGVAVAGARVTVKMISTAQQPRILMVGNTDDDGALVLDLEIPEVLEGSSALIIAADSAIGKSELKYVL